MNPPLPSQTDSDNSDQDSQPLRPRSTQYLEVPSTHQSRPTSRQPSLPSGPPSRTQSPVPLGVAFPILRSQPVEEDPPDLFALEGSVVSGLQEEIVPAPAMSTYSSSSQEDSVYSTPGPQRYQLVSPGTLNDPRTMSQVSPGFIYVTFLTHSDLIFRHQLSFRYPLQSNTPSWMFSTSSAIPFHNSTTDCFVA